MPVGGWAIFPAEDSIKRWARAALPLADAAAQGDWECGGTWFVGLDAIANDAEGTLPCGTPLVGAAVDAAAMLCGGLPVLHRAQASIVRPGYPKPRAGESDAAFAYRARRDAAHVDGVLGEGTPKRRFAREAHGFILGLPLTENPQDAAPLVVWEGSHLMMRAALKGALDGYAVQDWPQVDITDVYTQTRRSIFEQCQRVALSAPVGGAILLDRHLLHGVAPWQSVSTAPRAIAYLRPELPGGLADWIALP